MLGDFRSLNRAGCEHTSQLQIWLTVGETSIPFTYSHEYIFIYLFKYRQRYKEWDSTQWEWRRGTDSLRHAGEV